jgi:hypothetical protein
MRRQPLILVALVLLGIIWLALNAAMIPAAPSAQPTAHATYWPPILEFGFETPVVARTTVKFSIGARYLGGLSIYRELRKTDIIPSVRMVLYLPPGLHIVWHKIKLGVFTPGDPVSPPADFRYRMINGRPVWVYHHVGSTPIPRWEFKLNRPADGRQHCIGMVATEPLVRHAPAQKSTACFMGTQQ